MCAQFAIRMLFNRAVRARPALFSTFLVSWCLAAGCELFTSIGFIIIVYWGVVLIRAASNSTAVTFALVTEGWPSSREAMKGEGISSGPLTSQTNPSRWSHLFWHEIHVSTCILVGFVAPPHWGPDLRLCNGFSQTAVEREIGLCLQWVAEEPVLTGSMKKPPHSKPSWGSHILMVPDSSFISHWVVLFCWNFIVSHCLQWQLKTSA